MIKKATTNDASVLAELAMELWHGNTITELKTIFVEIADNEDAVCYIKYVDNRPIGFAQCQLRYDYVEGTDTSPVGYLEGIFIKDEFQHNGFAKELLLECEHWAKKKNCSEFASDCELGNVSSLKFHLTMGFDEANRIICFRKDI